MTAEIISLADRRPGEASSAGNGAREALIEVMSGDMPERLGKWDEADTDWILAMLWYRGFKIVPLE